MRLTLWIKGYCAIQKHDYENENNHSKLISADDRFWHFVNVFLSIEDGSSKLFEIEFQLTAEYYVITGFQLEHNPNFVLYQLKLT